MVQYEMNMSNNISLILEAAKSRMTTKCHVTIKSPTSDSYVMLNVEKFNKDYSSKCGTYIVIETQTMEYQICEKDKRFFLGTVPGSISFRFFVGSDGKSLAFRLYANSIKNAPCTYPWDFACKNKRCISKKLVDDGVNNCGDDSDEGIWRGLSQSAIAGIAIGVLLLIAAVSGTIWLCSRRRIITTTYIRQ